MAISFHEKPILCATVTLLSVAWTSLAPPITLAQVGVTHFPDAASASSPKISRKLAFDVISIRPSKSWGAPTFERRPDGYRAKNQTLWMLLITAYVPESHAAGSKDPILGAPAWIKKDLFDFEAKVTQNDQAEWQRQQNQRFPNPMLSEMLQSTLVERCKLVVHTSSTEMPGYALVAAKHGINLKRSIPTEQPMPSNATPLSGGGYVISFQKGQVPNQIPKISFYGASMDSFAIF